MGGRVVRNARLSVWLGAAWLGVAALTLAPRSLVAPARAALLAPIDGVLLGLDLTVTTAHLERLLNTALFVPLGLLLAVTLGRRWWWAGIPVGLAVSATVEVLQRGIPGRVPDPDDVLWNTVGAAVGVALGALVLLGGRHRHAKQRL